MGHITTQVLLILSTFSDELAARVIAYSPDLEPQVKEVLKDPAAYLQSLRDNMPDVGPPPDEQSQEEE